MDDIGILIAHEHVCLWIVLNTIIIFKLHLIEMSSSAFPVAEGGEGKESNSLSKESHGNFRGTKKQQCT